jgi:prevent-host-death family protein
MAQYNVHEAKTQLSRLLDRVEKGEEVVIARDGKPVAKLVAVSAAREPRQFGLCAGQDFWIAPDFDETSDDVVRLFEEGE